MYLFGWNNIRMVNYKQNTWLPKYDMFIFAQTTYLKLRNSYVENICIFFVNSIVAKHLFHSHLKYFQALLIYNICYYFILNEYMMSNFEIVMFDFSQRIVHNWAIIPEINLKIFQFQTVYINYWKNYIVLRKMS